MNDEMAIILSDLADATKKLRDATIPFHDHRSSENSSTSTIHVNAGGAGLWIAVTCCIVTTIIAIGMGIGWAVTAYKQGTQIDRMQDYLNAIYVQAPQLKPKESE